MAFSHNFVQISSTDVISRIEARERLKEVMDGVVADHQPVVIFRQETESVVMVSIADWHAIEGTLHLLSSLKNSERLRSAIDELNARGGTGRSLTKS